MEIDSKYINDYMYTITNIECKYLNEKEKMISRLGATTTKELYNKTYDFIDGMKFSKDYIMHMLNLARYPSPHTHFEDDLNIIIEQLTIYRDKLISDPKFGTVIDGIKKKVSRSFIEGMSKFIISKKEENKIETTEDEFKLYKTIVTTIIKSKDRFEIYADQDRFELYTDQDSKNIRTDSIFYELDNYVDMFKKYYIGKNSILDLKKVIEFFCKYYEDSIKSLYNYKEIIDNNAIQILPIDNNLHKSDYNYFNSKINDFYTASSIVSLIFNREITAYLMTKSKEELNNVDKGYLFIGSIIAEYRKLGRPADLISEIELNMFNKTHIYDTSEIDKELSDGISLFCKCDLIGNKKRYPFSYKLNNNNEENGGIKE